MDEVKEVIREFILSTYLVDETRENLRDETPLQSSGVLDSLATLGLVMFLERHYGIELNVYDTSVERFDRIEDIAACIVRKKADVASRD